MLAPRYLFSRDFSAFRQALLALPHRRRRFARKECLWQAGEHFEKIYFLESGLARTSILSTTGGIRTICWHGAETVFPVVHRNRFEIESRHVTEAMTTVMALEFTAGDIESFLRQSPDFAMATIDWYAKFVNLLLYSAADVATAPTLQAVATALELLFCNESGAAMAEKGVLTITQSELADLIGIDRASLVRVLSALRLRGALATRRGAIELKNLSLLRAAASTS